MGISGLLPFLKDAQEDIHISKYKGKVLGIDAYVWLHRGAYGCAKELALGQRTSGYVNFAMKRIQLLRHNGITPYVVFDGGYLPAKAGTEKERAKRREENLRLARSFHQKGAPQAREYFVKCVDVTHAMAYEFIKALREAKVQYIVAPYEADAQLAYLERNQDIDGIITEDSDLLVFGCKTVIYKLSDDGRCVEMLYQNRKRCKGLQLATFSDDTFRQMAILSGCDYLDSIPGMGLKTAHRLLRTCGTVAKALTTARLDGLKVPLTYQKDFERAEKTFVYQRVFRRCKRTGQITMVTLNPCYGVDDIEAEDCIGPLLPADQIDAISKGDMDPITKKMVRDTQHSIARSASAPSKMSSSNARNGRSRPEPDVGQVKLSAFFSHQAVKVKKEAPINNKPNASAAPTPVRNPLTSIENTAKSTSIAKHEETTSRYFSHASPEFDKGVVTLAHFTPTQQKKPLTRCASTDSGEISSPVSSARRPGVVLKHDSSPLADHTQHSSPTTSPLSFRIKYKSDKDIVLAPQHKSPIIADSDIEEEDETISPSFHELFGFQPDTPTNGRLVGGWTRERLDESDVEMTSARRSVSRSISGGKKSAAVGLLQFKREQEEEYDVRHTPALKRRHTESDQTGTTTIIPSITQLKKNEHL